MWCASTVIHVLHMWTTCASHVFHMCSCYMWNTSESHVVHMWWFQFHMKSTCWNITCEPHVVTCDSHVIFPHVNHMCWLFQFYTWFTCVSHVVFYMCFFRKGTHSCSGPMSQCRRNNTRLSCKKNINEKWMYWMLSWGTGKKWEIVISKKSKKS